MTSGWRETRLKYLFVSVRNGTWGDEPTGEGDVLCIRGTDFNRATNRVDGVSAPQRSVTLSAVRDLMLQPGDLILEKSGGSADQPVGSVALFDLPVRAVCSNFNARAQVSTSVDSRFTCYLINSLYWSGFTGQFVKQVTGIQNLDSQAFMASTVKLPSLDEQRRIADFLDIEAGRIGKLVGSHLRAVELLDERVTAQILNIVRRSRLVDPKGAVILPLKRLLMKQSRPARLTDAVVTAFRDGQVTSRSVRRAEGYTLTANAEPQGQGVEIGDVVVHGLDGFAGAIGDAETVGNCSPVYHVCVPIDGGNAQFYGRFLRELALGNYLGLFATSTRERAVDFRNWQLFGSIPVPNVDPGVQHEIGNQILGVRPLRADVARFNERLAERRRTLITAAVTGQIDVTTARGVDV